MSVWASVDRIVDGEHDLAGLRLHGIHLLAGRRWRALGRPIPAQLLEEERVAAIAVLGAEALLTRVRSVVDGPIVLHKGPEVAARYPDPALRAFGDVDLLVPDAAGAQHALLMAGFEPVGDPRMYVGLHHQRPLRWSGSPLLVEIHESPGWLSWMTPPSNTELFAAAGPVSCGVEGILSLSPSHHALALVAHAWRHRPLSRLVDLIDVAVLAAESDARELDALAREWGLDRVWATTRAAIETLLVDSPAASWPLRLWARHLRSVRERTLLEEKLVNWFGGFWALPPRAAVRGMLAAVGHDVRPHPGESWLVKAKRTTRAGRHAFMAYSQHVQRPGRPW